MVLRVFVEITGTKAIRITTKAAKPAHSGRENPEAFGERCYVLYAVFIWGNDFRFKRLSSKLLEYKLNVDAPYLLYTIIGSYNLGD